MKWPKTSVGDVALVNPRLLRSDRMKLNDPVSFIPMAAVSEKTVRIEAYSERPFAEVCKGYTPFRRGDVLIAKITPCFENGKMAYAEHLPHEIGFGTTEFHVLRPTVKIFGAYLFNLLRTPYVRKAGAMKMQGAAGQRRVPADFFAKIIIPLPPLSEQKRIAKILDAADALRAKRRVSLAQLDALIQTTFLDMFGDPVTNPKNFERKSIGEILKVKSGNGLVAKDMTEGGKYPVYGGNGVNGHHSSFMFEDSRIVIGRVGFYCGSIHLTKPKSWITDNALYVEKFFLAVDIKYLLESLKYANLNQYAGRAAQPLISGSRIYPVSILMPPLDLQHHFASIVESIERQKARFRAHLAELDALFASLQHRAFNGEV